MGAFCHKSAHFANLPLIHGSPSSGAFGMAGVPSGDKAENYPDKIMVVGGDYQHPDMAGQNAVLIRL